MKPMSVVRFGIVAGAIAAAGLSAAPAFGAPAQVDHQNGAIPAGYPWDLGPSPAGLPQTCQFPNNDANFVFQSGTFVSHGTGNANGDWGGLTAQGPAVFYEDSTPIAQGHLTIWEGGGNNAKAQTEGGFTLDFAGSGASGTVQIHVNGHMTTNAQGQPTAGGLNVNVTCS